MEMKKKILRYWLAMNASAFAAAVHSSVAFFGVAGAHAAMDAIPALTIQQFAAVFLIAFGRAILNYLDAHPLTDLLPPEHEDALDRVNQELSKIHPPGE
jgi:hypothetical protein